MPLGGVAEGLGVSEQRAVVVALEPLFNAVGQGDFVPVEIAREPPRFVFGQPGQSPVSELGEHQRFVPFGRHVAVGAEDPAGPRREVSNEPVEVFGVIGDGVVMVEVGDIRGHVEIVAAGAVVHHEPARHDALGFRISALEPGAVAGFLQVCPPAFVDDAHNDDGRVVPVAFHHAAQRGERANLGVARELVPVGDLVPDEDSSLIRGLEVARVRHFDVAAQQVQAERLGFFHLVFQVIE